jgi:hypothetical protein
MTLTSYPRHSRISTLQNNDVVLQIKTNSGSGLGSGQNSAGAGPTGSGFTRLVKPLETEPISREAHESIIRPDLTSLTVSVPDP